MIARNDDSGSGHFTAKKFTVIHPEDLPKTYRSVLSHVEVPLPEGALRFTAMPNAVEGKGIWAASGVNAANVGMTATETITSIRDECGRRLLVVRVSDSSDAALPKVKSVFITSPMPSLRR